jgi:dipeptidyl aminopeptidase/acylaminoacyl peptidase
MITSLLIAAAFAVQPAPSPAHNAATPKPAETVAPAAAPVAAPVDWKVAESALLTGHVQLTRREDFIKAGEAYFSRDGQRIIFQAIPVPKAGEGPDQFYSMYVADVSFDGQAIKGLTNIKRVSPAGSANTCGWFHPTDNNRLLFGSTIVAPSAKGKPGFQVGTSRYIWQFPEEMEVVAVDLSSGGADAQQLKPLFSRPGYDAECSYSNDGRFVLYANVDPAKAKPDGHQDADIYILDTKTSVQHPIVVAPGYDGGPFFSPDGDWICYRSDRAGNDLLQVYVAKLKYQVDADGTRIPVGIEREYQLTHNEHVNWGPFWHPSGTFLVYATSEVSHRNYEVFAIESDSKKLEALSSTDAAQAEASGAPSVVVPDARTRRVTFADGADVLPVFSPDGEYMMWTSQRGPKLESEEKPSSQLWIASWPKSSMFEH